MITGRLIRHKDEAWFVETWINEKAFWREFAQCHTIGELITTQVSAHEPTLKECIGKFLGFFWLLWIGGMAVCMLWFLLRWIWRQIVG